MFTTVLTTNNFPWEFRLPLPNGQRQLDEPYARWLLKVMRAGNARARRRATLRDAVRPRLRVIGCRHAGQSSEREARHILMKLSLIKHAARKRSQSIPDAKELREQSYPIMSARNKRWPSPSRGRPAAWQLVWIPAQVEKERGRGGWWVLTFKQHLADVN